jgi:hypothetical protein
LLRAVIEGMGTLGWCRSFHQLCRVMSKKHICQIYLGRYEKYIGQILFRAILEIMVTLGWYRSAGHYCSGQCPKNISAKSSAKGDNWDNVSAIISSNLLPHVWLILFHIFSTESFAWILSLHWLYKIWISTDSLYNSIGTFPTRRSFAEFSISCLTWIFQIN